MSFSRALEVVSTASELDEFQVHLVPQQHEAYGADDHRVWREVLKNNEWLISSYGKWIPGAYKDGIGRLSLPNYVPRIEEINERLAPTGWKTVCVDGYIPTAAYVGLMALNIFPISRTIRRPEHIDFAPAPDMVHDILGHLPMLFSAEHREFLQKLAVVMSRARDNEFDAELYAANRQLSQLKSDPTSSAADISEAEAHVMRVHAELRSNPSESTHLRRMYLWSVEFGLIGTADDFSIYGAALLSSPAEFQTICDNAATIWPYSLSVVERDIEFSNFQTKYFRALDFGHLTQVLADYEATMGEEQSHTRLRAGASIRPAARPA